jgi:methylenetetrahydrofolate dehydrogenase (NADP+)/methenyltetrahydrofolate cyclohydrolase
MAARIIDGKAIAAKVRAEVAEGVRELVARAGRPPGLAVVLCGDDPASQVYVKGKGKASREAGLHLVDHALSRDTTETELLRLVASLAEDPRVDGILVQLPLPPHIDEGRVLDAIPADKDVDGFHAVNVGRLWSGDERRLVSCTPAGVMRLLAESDTPLKGAEAVVVGRSNIVGKPMAALLLEADATVTVCHSKTRDLAAHIQRADVVVAAVGRPEMVRGAWIKPGATVIDVGVNRMADGRLVGDVEFSVARERAGAITPVPGGVGPMTIAHLLKNTLHAARRHTGVDIS